MKQKRKLKRNRRQSIPPAANVYTERPVDSGTRKSFAERWFLVLSLVCGLLCVLFIFREFFLSRFDRIFSDPGDGRLCITLLEHWVKVFQGRAQAASPDFYFPQRGVLGYTVTLFLYAPPYAALRFFGLGRYLAFEVTMMLITAIGFASMLWLLRRLLRLNPWLQILGASLFTISNVYYAQMTHPQLVSVAFVPLLGVLAIEYWRASTRNRARCYIATVGVLLALLLFTTFDIGWFTILFCGVVFAFFILASILAERSVRPVKRGVQLLWARKWDLLLGFFAFALCLIPLFAVYLPVLRRMKGRSLEDALQYMPGLLSAFDVGSANLLWGRIARDIYRVWGSTGPREDPAGWPVVTLCVFVVSGFYFATLLCRSRKKRYPSDKQLLAFLSALSLACVVLWLVSVRIHDSTTGWAIVWRLVPGASAMRVPQRISLVLNVGVVLVCIAGVSAFVRAQSPHRMRIYLAAVLLPIVLLAEQVNSTPSHKISRLAEARKFERIPPPPKVCSSFFISDESPAEISPIETQTDAMLIAQQFDIPTLNGYSGWFPKGWNLFQTVDDGGYAAILWARRQGLNRGLCRLDFAGGRWFSVDPEKPLAVINAETISEIIKNPGFEHHDLSAWRTYRSVQISLTSAVAHHGTSSLMETSGEGSAYQDVTGLLPDHVYRITAWVAASRDATVTAQIGVYDPSKNVATFSPMVTPDEVWQEIENAVFVGVGGNLRIHLFRNRGTGAIYWDDVSVDLVK